VPQATTTRPPAAEDRSAVGDDRRSAVGDDHRSASSDDDGVNVGGEPTA
jgi:hypothetical protein